MNTKIPLPTKRPWAARSFAPRKPTEEEIRGQRSKVRKTRSLGRSEEKVRGSLCRRHLVAQPRPAQGSARSSRGFLGESGGGTAELRLRNGFETFQHLLDHFIDGWIYPATQPDE